MEKCMHIVLTTCFYNGDERYISRHRLAFSTCFGEIIRSRRRLWIFNAGCGTVQSPCVQTDKCPGAPNPSIVLITINAILENLFSDAVRANLYTKRQWGRGQESKFMLVDLAREGARYVGDPVPAAE